LELAQKHLGGEGAILYLDNALTALSSKFPIKQVVEWLL